MRRWVGAICLALGLAVASVAAAQTPTIAYTYDTLGRVTSATYTGGPNDGLIVTYTYDALGNRTQYTSNGKGNSRLPKLVVVPLLGLSVIQTGW